jgi:tRNA A-37 threonylcarbamoyl transferase component Bud32/TolA-binding protein
MMERKLSHYRVLEQLGKSASSEVYLAEDLVLGRQVVLKLLSPRQASGPDARARLLQEARTISSLNHPNICTIHEIAEHDGRPFLVMELLDGQPLSALMTGRPLATMVLIDLAIQMADGLDAAHLRGIVHRDIKPPNLFVTRRGQLKILDFGIAVLAERDPRRGTEKSVAVAPWGGTLPYMSPEQIRGGAIDARSDLFSLGCVLYEMATGRPAFTGRDVPEVAAAILTETPASPVSINAALPAGLDRIVMGTLEKDRRLRSQTAADVRSDLQRVKRDLEAAAISAQAFAPSRTQAARRALAAAASRRRSAAAITALAACGVTALTVLGAPDFSRRTPEPVAEETAAAPSRSATARPARSATAPERAATPEAEAEPPAPEPAPAPAATPRPAAVETPEPPRPASSPPPPPATVEPAVVAPPSIETELRLARAQAGHKLHDQALRTLREALGRDGTSALALEAHFMIASIHEARQAPDEAMAAYVLIADRFRDHPRAAEALFSLSEATRRSRRDDREAEARKILGDIVARYPRSVWAVKALMAKADLEERAKLHEFDDKLGTVVPTALITYRRVIERDGSPPEREHALWKAGQTYERIKRYYLAAQAYATLGDQYPETGYDAWAAAARVYDKRLKDEAQARAAYARVPASSPSFRDAQKYLGR